MTCSEPAEERGGPMTPPAASVWLRVRLAHFIALPRDRCHQMVVDRSRAINGPCQVKMTAWNTSSRAQEARGRRTPNPFPRVLLRWLELVYRAFKLA